MFAIALSYSFFSLVALRRKSDKWFYNRFKEFSFPHPEPPASMWHARTDALGASVFVPRLLPRIEFFAKSIIESTEESPPKCSQKSPNTNPVQDACQKRVPNPSQKILLRILPESCAGGSALESILVKHIPPPWRYLTYANEKDLTNAALNRVDGILSVPSCNEYKEFVT